jgi:hypothetical protein
MHDLLEVLLAAPCWLSGRLAFWWAEARAVATRLHDNQVSGCRRRHYRIDHTGQPVRR